uniref:G-protein coupled receptors family 1 profile domain-containing protein n=1 Tax=Plectus sambesii TaxID=2011161 RepID=A0A914XDQ7_9BILA
MMLMEQDPPSALGLSIWYLLMAALGLPLNLFIISSTIVRRSLRAVPMNWLVLSAAVADTAYLLSLAVFLRWSLAADHLVCKISGFAMYYFGMISIFTAPFLAALRFMALSGNSRFGSTTNRRGVIGIDCGIWIVSALLYLPFVILDKFGIEKVGTCGITHEENWYELPYFLFCSGTLFVAYSATFFFNRRLHSWVKNMNTKLLSLTGESKVTLSDTRNLMKIFRWFLIVPVIAFLPTLILQILYRTNIQLLNIRFDRVVVAFGALPAVINPFVTIKYLRPYRLVMEAVGSKIPFFSSPIHFLFKEDQDTSWERMKVNVTNKVQAVYRISIPVLSMRNNSVSVYNTQISETLPTIVL